MGNYFSDQELWIEADELDYYSTECERNVGTVDIFTSNRHLPMSYIMRLERPLEEGAELLELYQEIEGKRKVGMIKLYDCRKVRRCGCGSIQEVTKQESYWEYYNFYLIDLIRRRQARSVFFGEDELWYLAKVCCEGYLLLRQHGMLMDIGPDRIVVTPEGKLKLFWAHIRPKNSHLNYYRCLLFGERLVGCYSPEELESMRNQELSARIDLEKSNVYTFGMCLFFCMTLVDPGHFYTTSQALDISQLTRTLTTYRQKHVYSPLLWELLEDCLQLQPMNRPKFRELQQKYSGKFQQDFSMSIISSSNFERTQADRSLTESAFNQTRISLRKRPDGTSICKTKSQFSSAI